MSSSISSKFIGTGFSSLKHRNFRLFFIGQCISLIGTWMQNIGQSWLVLQLTPSALKFSLVTMMQFLPMLVFSLFAGTVIDRFSKRKVLIFTQTSMMILALILATLTYLKLIQYWHILVLALLLGIVNTLDMPTRQSYFIELVGRKDLMNAIALNSGIFNLARVVGPAIAGVLIGLVGITICFYLNALSFVAVIISLFMINTPFDKPVREKIESFSQVFVDIKNGLRYIKHNNVILVPLILIAVISLFAMNYSVLIPLFASRTLGQEAGGYGFIMTCMGLGSLTGAMVIAARSQSGPKYAYMIVGALATGLFMSILGLVSTYLIACVTVYAIGLSSIVFTALANSIVQLNSVDQMRGRVMSVYTLVFLGVVPIGSLVTGGLVEIIGISWTMILSGLVSIVITLLTVYFLRNNRTPKTA